MFNAAYTSLPKALARKRELHQKLFEYLRTLKSCRAIEGRSCRRCELDVTDCEAGIIDINKQIARLDVE